MLTQFELQPTVLLYDDDAYAVSFRATVLFSEVRSLPDGTMQITAVFDRTLFFPEEGGQTPDKGTVLLTDKENRVLESYTVTDVQIHEGVITHTLLPDLSPADSCPTAKESASSFSPQLCAGCTVLGNIDWDYRFSNMQQHSGEHIFSGLVYSSFGYSNVGFHLSDHIVTMDYNGILTKEQVQELEYRANKAIAENVPILAEYPSADRLAAMTYRSKKELCGPIRIVTVTGYDVCACCAPHVHHTGEIGLLKVMSLQNYKGGVRLSILCGFRALKAFTEKMNTLSSLTGLLTTAEDSLSDSVQKLRQENVRLKQALCSAQRDLLFSAAAAVPCTENNLILFASDCDAGTARFLCNDQIDKRNGFCAVFFGTGTPSYSFLIGSRKKDCRELATLLRNTFGAKGGGSNEMIQGSVSANKEDLLTFFDSLQCN